MSLRNRALTRYRRSGGAAAWDYYKLLRNLANSSICTEKLFFKNLSRFSSSKNFWHFLSVSGFHKPSHSSSVPDSFPDPSAINNHFLDSLPSTSAFPELVSYYLSQAHESSSSSSSFTFAPFSLGDLFSIFKTIKLTSSNPYDISGIMIFHCVPYCLDSLLHIFNSAILSESFPAAWKHSFVYPIPKSANPTTLDSLRPISLTPFLSKVLEKLCFAQLLTHFDSCSAIPPFQSGFRRGYSTSTALLHISNTVLRAFDSRRLTCITSLDFSKAFDTIDHNLLCAKLSYLGLSSSALLFLKSYLSPRTQQVVLKHSLPLTSTIRQTSRGVPQGSVLGPLLFNVYVCDLPAVCNHCQAYMYADDTQLIKVFDPSGANLAKAEIEADLRRLIHWSDSHGLQLNPAKTTVLVAGSPTSLSNLPSFDISFGSTVLGVQPVLKNLGVTFDPHWCFDRHVAVLCRSAFSRMRSLYPLRRTLSTNTKLLLCQALIISIFDYADVVYGPCLSSSRSSVVQRVQNSCLRFSYNVRKYDHITPSFQRSGWLKMKQRWIFHLCCLVYKILATGTPRYLYELLHSNLSMRSSGSSGSSGSMTTRHCFDLSVPSHRSCKFTASFSYISSYYYNSIPPNIRSLSSFASFKHSARSFILSRFPT